jgi:hypothetical protein
MTFEYIHKLGNKTTHKINIKKDDIPNHILEIINNNESFSQSSSFGQKGLGDPDEFEELILRDGNDVRVFTYYNKGIHYMMNSTEKNRSIFQVFVYFMLTANHR